MLLLKCNRSYLSGILFDEAALGSLCVCCEHDFFSLENEIVKTLVEQQAFFIGQ
jgi:hypothetical protein